MTSKVIVWRPVIFMIGLGAGLLGCFGAYEYALKLEGGQLTYLVVAAPLVAMMATLIPPLAEHCWKNGEHLKSMIWWASLLPVAALIFLSAAERVHMAKANQTAEITAKNFAAVRAREVYKEAKDALTLAEADEAKAKATKNCNTQCRTRFEQANMARSKFAEAEINLAKVESVAVIESFWKPPVWLLPASLDIIAFLGIWTGLAGPWVVRFSKFKYSRRRYEQMYHVKTQPQIGKSGRPILTLNPFKRKTAR